MTNKTKLFACTQTSNILGTINDVKAIAKTVHEVPGALFCVDAVAYAPHRAIDVRDWGVDFYSFSWYKPPPLYSSHQLKNCLSI
jgi:selenocysteine lyase/cysteine desulfurase